MKKRRLLLMVCVLSAVAFAMPLHAQRLTPGQKGLEIATGIPIVKGEKRVDLENIGAFIGLSRYLKQGDYLFLAAEYAQENRPYTHYRIPIKDALLHLGYMYPFCSDRGKNILLYAGVSALGGYEELNNSEELLPDGALLRDRSRFIYGGALMLSGECFLTDNLLFLIKGQARLFAGSDLNLFRLALSAGLRLNF